MPVLVCYRRGPSPDYDRPLEQFTTAYQTMPAGMAHRLVMITQPFPGRDIAALKHTCKAHAGEELLVWLCSRAHPVARRWLAGLVSPLRDPTIGMAAACGSYEQAPHLRTSALVIRPRLLTQLYPEPVTDHAGCYRFEHGADNVTLRMLRAGHRAVVAGCDGHYDLPDWAQARTYRSGDQENLLVADTHTDLWYQANRARIWHYGQLAGGLT